MHDPLNNNKNKILENLFYQILFKLLSFHLQELSINHYQFVHSQINKVHKYYNGINVWTRVVTRNCRLRHGGRRDRGLSDVTLFILLQHNQIITRGLAVRNVVVLETVYKDIFTLCIGAKCALTNNYSRTIFCSSILQHLCHMAIPLV